MDNKITRLVNVINKSSRKIIGLMSGMSMDGVDLAFVNISGAYPNLDIKLEGSDFLKYPTTLVDKLKIISSSTSQRNDFTCLISEANFEVAECFSKVVNSFLSKNAIKVEEIDAIGSHGQTIFHKASYNESLNNTLQIGSGPLIAERTGILTIYNFREADIAANGLGAPFVPLVDYLLFREDRKIKTYTNLGSIANTTLIPEKIEDLRAFDLSPANMPIDFFSRKVPEDNIGYDRDSMYSMKGKVIEPLLNELLAHEYLKKKPPKTLGFGEFGNEYLTSVSSKYSEHNSYDFVRTAVEFCSLAVSNAFKDFIIPEVEKLSYQSLSECIFTGGGSKNKLLIERLKFHMPNLPVSSLNDTLKEFSDAKEALAFAVLANEFLSGRAGSLPQVTGVREGTLLGCIAP